MKIQDLDKSRTMNTLKYIRLREEGSLNERTFKRAILQKCDWAYEDFLTAEMVQDSTMCLLQEGFRKEDEENTCLQNSVDTLVTVGRIIRRTREMHKQYYEILSEESEETERSVIAKMVNKVIEKYLQSMSLWSTLEIWRLLDNWYDLSRDNYDLICSPYFDATYLSQTAIIVQLIDTGGVLRMLSDLA
ncbi:hypothetical protein CEXT_354631 [Caerostris extrusa]|uniref:Terpene synthase n=1 Tax=Caerostris extrusa TaxID=172846 RepID=A0AAV4UTJ6_CAEEX|nr:hypothetical protein CEXT_354631 [Caerostris extrusa]